MNNSAATSRIGTLGIDMPPDFPSQLYSSIHERFIPYLEKSKENWLEYGWGWNAVASRFKTCSINRDFFERSLEKHGVISLAHDDRYIQDNSLFIFFIAGESALDSLFYSTYFICALLGIFKFQLTEKFKKSIKIDLLMNCLNCSCPTDSLTTKLGEIANSDEFSRWKKIRNVLIHRSAPGRNFGDEGVIWQLEKLKLNKDLTTKRYQWLSSALKDIMSEINLFSSKYVTAFTSP